MSSSPIPTDWREDVVARGHGDGRPIPLATRLNTRWLRHTPGIEVTIGPLGHGISMAVGPAAAERIGADKHTRWRRQYDAYRGAHPDLADGLDRPMAGRLPDGWPDDLPSFGVDAKDAATRSRSGEAINALAPAIPELVGGSVDLAPSTNTTIEGAGDIATGEWGGRNFHFGVRSVAMGEDGPTHLPVEHLAGLRAVPSLDVIRPADGNETAAAWRLAPEVGITVEAVADAVANACSAYSR